MEMRGIFPARFIPGSLEPAAYVLILTNWLDFEFDQYTVDRYPILKQIAGHRRREVISFLEQMPDWTAGILNTKMVM